MTEISQQPEFTKGPWAITNDGTLPIHVGVKDGRWKGVPGTLLAEVGGNLVVGTGNFQEDLANARLIAAAPTMFKALEAMLAYGDSKFEGNRQIAVEMAHAAMRLAKTGGPHEASLAR